MKKESIKLIAVALLMAFSLSAFAAEKTETSTVAFTESEFSFSENEDGVLTIQASDNLDIAEGVEGAPALPFIAYDVDYAGEVEYVKHTFTFTKRLIKSNVLIENAPTPGVYPESNCVYSETQAWPTGKSVEEPTTIRLLLCPFVYDATEKSLYFIDNMEISLTTEGDAASIDSQLVDEENVSEPIYDMHGRRVTTTNKGQLYIQGGKKVVR